MDWSKHRRAIAWMLGQLGLQDGSVGPRNSIRLEESGGMRACASHHQDFHFQMRVAEPGSGDEAASVVLQEKRTESERRERHEQGREKVLRRVRKGQGTAKRRLSRE